MSKITITTNIELTKEKKAEIISQLEKKYGDADYVFHVDYEIIGGIMLFDGDKIYDGSIRTQLEIFKEKIKS
jgi:F0F1-type ATP synthase delta subunit